MLNIFDATSKKGLSWYFRQRRMRKFLSYLESVKTEQVKILDLGGTPFFWERIGLINSERVHITILNLFEQKSDFNNITCAVGDVTDIKTFPNNNFDIIFSNSVIEHLFTYENQKKMADNILKLGEKIYLQTPNFYFPIEPHFIFPFFHYLPRKARLFLITHFSLGSYKKMSDHKQAEEAVDEIKILKPKQVKKLFPSLRVGYEKVLFANKSIIAQNLY